MKLSTFSKMATPIYLSGKCAYLRSAPGRGKTTCVKDAVPKIAAELGKRLGFVLINGPLLTPADTVGYLVPVKKPDGTVESSYTLPFWWRTEDNEKLEAYEGGVIFIDEADKMDIDVKKVVGEMALSGRCGPHILPPGWVVWMAGNRQGDRSGSTKELDHLINRRFEIDVTDDILGWEQWAIKNNVAPTIIAFAVSNPQIVFPDSLPKEQGPFCTPRSLVAVGELLGTLAGNEGKIPVSDDAVELAAAGIGQAAAAQLFATIKLESELPDIAAVIGNPGSAKLPKAPDAQMLVCYKLASLTDQDNIDPVITYVERLPADFSATYAKAVVTRHAMLAAHPAMLAWCRRNSGLMSILASLK
jgi:hypothetical protein